MNKKFVLSILGLAFVLLNGTAGGFSQLPAPGALSDFARCNNRGCLWVPSSAARTFTRGDFNYRVEVSEQNEKDNVFVVRRAGKELLRTPLKGLSASTSVFWSSDNKSFAVTWSDGGSIGNFHVRAFHINGESVAEWPAAEKAYAAFSAQHWCAARGDNVQAYQWLPNSSELILVLSVYPTSDCGAELGHTEAYVVDAATGSIRERWGAARLESYIRAHPQ